MKRRTKWTLAAAGIVAVLLAVLAGAGCYMLDYALGYQTEDRVSASDRRARIQKDFPWTAQWMDSVYQARAVRDTFVTMPSGERHHAIYLRAPQSTPRTAIVVHGYKVRAEGMLHIAYIYNKVMGWNVLLPDLHAHGMSPGEDIRMGWTDRWDVLRWAAVADTLFAPPGGHTLQVMHGISMGAATVMALSGEDTPDYVKAFVEDCGYCGVWDEFAAQLQDEFGLPAFPLMHVTSALCRLKHGWSFGQADMERQVARCSKPMLFIHGDNDTFVPSWMVGPLHRAHRGPKRLFIARGSAHAMAYRDHRTEYETEMRLFFETCMPGPDR